MRTVHISWDPGAERFIATGAHPGQSISVNAPHRHEDADPTGFSATELLLAGAGACAAWDVVDILRKQRREVTGISIRVDGEQDPAPPHGYRKLGLAFTFRGSALIEGDLQRVVQLSIDRYCSVIETLRGRAEIESTVQVVDSDRPAD